MSKPYLSALPAALVLLTACGGGGPPRSNFVPADPQPGGARAIVVAGSDLRGGGSLLVSLRRHVAGMQVRQSTAGPCPEISFRGQRSLMGPSHPVVYVDGTRAANTCVLEMLNPGEVRTVEVYPQGVSRRPGYEAAAHGLILVFLRDGSEAT